MHRTQSDKEYMPIFSDVQNAIWGELHSTKLNRTPDESETKVRQALCEDYGFICGFHPLDLSGRLEFETELRQKCDKFSYVWRLK